MHARDFMGSLNAVHSRHGQIHHNDVRGGLIDLTHRFETVGSFSANTPAGMFLDDSANQAPDGLIIIHDQNPDRHGPSLLTQPSTRSCALYLSPAAEADALLCRRGGCGRLIS